MLRLPDPSTYIYKSIMGLTWFYLEGKENDNFDKNVEFLQKFFNKSVYPHMQSDEFKGLLLSVCSALESDSVRKAAARKFFVEFVLTLGNNFSSDDLNGLSFIRPIN